MNKVKAEIKDQVKREEMLLSDCAFAKVVTLGNGRHAMLIGRHVYCIDCPDWMVDVICTAVRGGGRAGGSLTGEAGKAA